ncbi:MAG: type I methionyl aminopeptidase [bacterium]|nr:type I methionyl aminopeptidase [bacterium]
MIKIKTKEEINIMAQGGKILAQIMKEVASKVEPGVTTEYLDKVAENLVFKFGAKASFKNYQGFPTVLCTSINEELVHCIPSERKLKSGDIVSLDLGILYKGYHSDMAITVPAGEASSEALRLIRTTKKTLKRGIKKVRPNITFGDIGNTMQRYVEDQGYSVIRDLCGHGIGRELHEDPQICNYGKRKTGEKIKIGMVFCLEPMIAMGDWAIKRSRDGYGFQMKDSSLCAHFEHTIVVTETGPKVLTG